MASIKIEGLVLARRWEKKSIFTQLCLLCAPVQYNMNVLWHFGTWRLDIVQSLYKFWAQSVLIPVLIVTSLHQNVSIIFVNNIYCKY